MDALEAIFTTFKFVSRRDICPYTAKHGTRDALGDLFAKLEFKYGAEIGVRAGDFSLTLCRKVSDLKLVCVDPWTSYNRRITQRMQDKFLAVAKERLAPFNVRYLKMTSMQALPEIEDRSLDFVFIDAEHDFDNAAMDIICWSKKVRTGGIVACHDYTHCYRGGVIHAVDAYTHCHDIRPWFLTEDYQHTAFWVNP